MKCSHTEWLSSPWAQTTGYFITAGSFVERGSSWQLRFSTISACSSENICQIWILFSQLEREWKVLFECVQPVKRESGANLLIAWGKRWHNLYTSFCISCYQVRQSRTFVLITNKRVTGSKPHSYILKLTCLAAHLIAAIISVSLCSITSSSVDWIDEKCYILIEDFSSANISVTGKTTLKVANQTFHDTGFESFFGRHFVCHFVFIEYLSFDTMAF